MPAAFDQPPEYQAQSTLRALSRSPIVAPRWGGSRRASGVPSAYGWKVGWVVLMAKSPHGVPGTAGGQATISAPSLTVPVALYSG